MDDSHRLNWLPYVAPMGAFLVLVELGGRVDDRFGLAMLALKVAVPAALLIFFASRGAYRELRIRWSSRLPIDGLVGIALAGLWIAPYVWLPQLRPDVEAYAFDPSMAGQAMIPFVLGLRMLGYAAVTPLMEELFMRSFLMRFVDVYDDAEQDFRDQPVGKFTRRSFLVVVAVFLATHAMWEWWVMLPWAVLSNLWFYYRKDLFAVIVLHAATNATILLAAIFLSGRITDVDGNPLSLWFFV